MRDFYKFAEKAIETAGEAGRRKRKHAITLEQMGAKSRMAELERTQLGETKRRGMIEAGALERGMLPARTELRGAKAPKSTRMASFDFANKAMSEMYPDRINPVTNKLFSPEAWKKRIIELAESREAYGGIRPAEERPIGLSGRGRVLRESGEMYDIKPGVEGYTKSRAMPGMVEAAGFLPRGSRAAQIAAGGEIDTEILPSKLNPGEASARLREEYNKENPDPEIIAELQKWVGKGYQWLKGKMMSPEGSYVKSPIGLRGYLNK
jgi:hypothetical protein